jgi:hypothetical protein
MERGAQFVNRRTIGLLVFLCFTVLGQWCALDAQHQQHRSDEHCCLLCHVGPHATLDTVERGYRAPVFSTAWITPAPPVVRPLQAAVFHTSSRAPPAESLS